ncbi:hypothetical protein CAEBREN_21371 [Caenorhabditis brenneri]|uniref:Uncharacterized protein n=1 Tax=Caenorhabditis brenneri TaxID=135651 RepID=G0N0R1_CAEBE|nr:hypothetical protein CAEBREN_21371 [Caenorhabditis brenneri]
MTERVIFMVSAKTSSMSTQDFLMVFNLHRLFIIKKKSLMKLYAIAIPIMLIGPIGDAYIKYPIIMAGRDIGLFVKHSQVPFIAVVIIICREKLKKEFDTNPTFSEKTKKLQKKLGLSVFMQVGLLCIIALIITIIPWLCENIFDESTYIAYSVYYLIYASVITQWYPFCSACLIAWSITGFFKNQSPPTTIQHSDTKIFQVEPQNIGARKQSTRLSLV